PGLLDLAGPVLRGLSVRPAPVRAGRRARLSLTLNEPATLTLTVLRAATRNRRVRWVSVRTLGARGVAGRNVLRLRRLQRAGRHRVIVRARDAAGNRSPSRSVGFRVVSSE
ncbi:MAG TPA: hypothetical protein VGW10_02025, partial [Solirubrobacteraceae bacterium]|nr:hypothetical protein [Solirubrobacteraceae bacterium]